MTPHTNAIPTHPRVTMRQVAQAAGVSLMTVSLALRNHPRIPEGTRQHVQKWANRMNYRPDPIVTRFMNGIRAGRRPAFHMNIAILQDGRGSEAEPYSRAIQEGIRERAEKLGYGVTKLYSGDYRDKQARFSKILQSRGVYGVILLPLEEPRDISDLLDWRLFSAVAVSYSVMNPHFHRIVPHQYYNMSMVIERLKRHGFRRLGLALIGRSFDQRINRAYSAAFALHNQEMGPAAIPPLVTADVGEVVTWAQQHQPDVILVNEAALLTDALRSRAGLRVPADVSLFDLGLDADSNQSAGLRQNPNLIGQVAVEQLVAMMQRGEIGVPATPQVTMIEGTFVEGASLRVSEAPRRRERRTAAD